MISNQDVRFYAKQMLFPSASSKPSQAAVSRTRQPLPELGIDLSQTSVSGVSSGGAMAIQMHIAHSAHMRGIGVTAGVAYDAVDSSKPLVRRMLRGVYKSIKGIADQEPNAEEVRDFSIKRTEVALKDGGIDDTGHLRKQRVWLFHGTRDNKIAKEAMDGVRGYYLNYVNRENVFYMDDIDAPHAQVTDDFGSPGEFRNSDHHIIDLDYDTPGRLLELIYGSLDENKGDYSLNNLKEFDQSEFVGYVENGKFKHIDPESVGLAPTGFVYIPSDYQREYGRVHIAFHGCDQYADETMEFVRNGGYNEWAENNNIIVLYPQSIGTTVPLNPKGCWDWFGYARPEKYRTQYARKDAYQISAI